ncbi:TPA: protein-L-isoaspartate(D-aspartate) O-methyltransferase [archaeon]|nr:protein-L-isoaspartate(D-aspartate) O-methyltransferase [Candidatus Naiadarchaeales archaeon SRR2090159.bin1288]
MSKAENEQMMDMLIEYGYLSTERVIKAFKNVDRADFAPEEYRKGCYEDTPLPIGRGQTISAPSMVAIMSEKLDCRPGMKILEIGAGSGYQAAILAEIIGSKGKLFTVERIKEVADNAKKVLGKYKNVKLIVGDGTLGYKKEAPFDRIIVTAASPKIPEPLVEQLKEGGKMLIPIGNYLFGQELDLITKVKGKIKEEFVTGVVFVPLIGKYGASEPPSP